MIKLELKNQILKDIVEDNEVAVDGIMSEQDFIFLGYTKEGALYQNDGGECLVLKLIAKKDDFDFQDALDEKEEQDKKNAEKKAKKAEKKAKKDEKVETEEETETEVEENGVEIDEDINDVQETVF
jgi:hypothetical protein